MIMKQTINAITDESITTQASIPFNVEKIQLKLLGFFPDPTPCVPIPVKNGGINQTRINNIGFIPS